MSSIQCCGQNIKEEIRAEDAAKILFLMLDWSRAQEEYNDVVESSSCDNPPPAEQLKDLLILFKVALMDGCLKGIQKKVISNEKGLLEYTPERTKHRSLQASIDNAGTSKKLRQVEEDILSFVEAMRTLRYEVPGKLKEFMDFIIDENEIPFPPNSDKTFFLFAENNLHLRIAAKMTADEVHTLWDSVSTCFDEKIEFTPNKAHLDSVSGMKDVAYFYLILFMVQKGKLNRIYTHHLIEVLNKVSESKPETANKINEIATSLKRYPMISHPPGVCLIFCMIEDRPGAEKDITKVTNFFEKSLCYDVVLSLDPTKYKFENATRLLRLNKFKYYDSLVIWIMAHGDEDNIQFKDSKMNRREILNEIMSTNTFQSKPKVIFIQACGTKIEQTETNYPSGRDTGNLESRYKRSLTTYNPRADTLVADATLWWDEASRCSDGSIYVKTVIDQLKKYGTTESLENVLKRVHYEVNQYKQEEKNGLSWKQSPYYETSFLKDFIFYKFPQKMV
ncbi:uncharacterized protein LOC143041830 isoform X2 [Oratosquilla oratoria]|uniref:uncharacterized protein LOC143041830 isoform X2 n=1 Tax=Oratosquilla oratoria TaxID=337810 RepID=UPI003F760FC2